MDLGRGLTCRFAASLALIAPVLWGLAPTAGADDLDASLYRPGTVNVIKLELPPSSIKGLEEDPEGEYQPGTFSMAETDGTPVGIGEYSTPIEAQIRLKGSGSFRPLGQKAAFKIKFAKKAPFRGLRKMTLNNMVQDASMVHETLSYRVFHAMGVPASRGSYAEVWVNGVNYGLHYNIESLDKVALEKRFGTFEDPPQHLYEGEYNADVTSSRSSLLEVDEGDEEDRSDLDALVAANTDPGGDWSNAVDPHLYPREMIRMWMAEKYIGHVDGYSGASGTNLPNNFYLYSDSAGAFRMLPWGTDQTWVFATTYSGAGGSLFNHCLADVSCLALYKAVGAKALDVLPQLDLDTMAKCTAFRLQAWQKREPPALSPHSALEINEAVTATRGYVGAAPKKLANYLGVPVPVSTISGECPAYGSEAAESLEEHDENWEGELPPEEEPEEEEPPEEEEGGGEEPPEEEGGEEEGEGGGQPEQPSPGSTPVTVSLPQPSLPLEEDKPVLLLRVGGVGMGRHGLLATIKAPRRGVLSLAISGPSGVDCHAHRRVKAGSTAVVCQLSSAELGSLTTHRRWLTIGASLRTDAGLKLNCWRTLKSPRPSR